MKMLKKLLGIENLESNQKELLELLRSENAMLRNELQEVRKQLNDSEHLNLKLDCALQNINDLEAKQDVLLSTQYDLKADLETQIDKLKLEIDTFENQKAKGA